MATNGQTHKTLKPSLSTQFTTSTTLTQWHPLSEGIQFTIGKNYTNLDISNFEPQCMSHGDNTFARSGYDIPLHGIGHSCFYTIHVIALVCLIMSLSSAVTVIVVLFKSQTRKRFNTWQKHERFLIYRCMCDMLYSLVHALDHVHVILTLDHVRPAGLCTLYAIILIDSCVTEASLSFVSALNAFVSIYFRKNFDFGRRDWKLVCNIFVIGPFSLALIVCPMDVLGPNGFYCGFDSVKGEIANAILSTGSMSAMLVSLSIMYVLTWWRIYIEAKKLKTSIPDGGSSRNATLRSAKAMCLFVAVYIIQWTPLCIYGTWQMISEVPFSLVLAVVLSTNVGGILSGVIYLLNSKSRNSVSNVNSSVNKGKLKPVQSRYQRRLSPIRQSATISNRTVKKEIFSTPSTEKF